jgi:hypothetical protein
MGMLCHVTISASPFIIFLLLLLRLFLLFLVLLLLLLQVPGGGAILGEGYSAVVRIDDDDFANDPCF